MRIQNPVLRGFYPDPSVCEANGKFYLACSTFQYFPGVPIFESEDLINWTQISNCLTRLNQIELHRVPSSGGVFAPTLRYHDGIFYMVTNNNSFGKNFYIFTNDIRGEWSDPIFVEQGGIDPSLLFDEGKVYFTSNGTYNGKGCVMQCEIDIKTGEKLTSTQPIWEGSGGRYLESPHLYHIGEYYYLMAAEGGTEYGHMITYARAESPFGPFEAYNANPVLTNKNLGGNESFIQGIGHGDLIQDKNGNYYIICLGFRQNGMWSPFHHLGREVFIAPVYFDSQGWFRAGVDGHVDEWMDININTTAQTEGKYDVHFDSVGLDDLRWEYLRDYDSSNYRFSNKVLELTGTSITLDEADNPTFIGIRQSEFNTDLRVDITSDAYEAGVTYYMDENQHYDMYVTNAKDGIYAQLRLRIGDALCIKNSVRLSTNKDIKFHIVSDPDNYSFYLCNEKEELLMGTAKCKYLSSEVAGGFTGVMMGLYAVDENNNKALFSKLDWEQRNS